MQVKVLEIRDEGTYALFAQPESPQQDTVPRSRYDACNADWLEAKAKLKQLEESATAAVLDAYTRCADQVPSTWIDPLLSGPDAVILGGSDGKEIEALLSAVRKRILAARDELKGKP